MCRRLSEVDRVMYTSEGCDEPLCVDPNPLNSFEES